jgi:hypothetical protein
MHEFLSQIEHSGFSTWVRESGSLWSYASVLFLHTVGLAFLVGLNVTLDLRLLGMAKRLPLAPFEGFYRMMWAGFWMNAVSGTILLAQDATTKLVNPVFYLKMLFVAAAVTLMVMTRRRVFRDPLIESRPPSPAVRALAWASLFCWAGAITAGRLMAYLGQDSGAPQFINRIGG